MITTYLNLQGRMKWLKELATQAGGEQAAQDLLRGRGIGLILKKFDVDFKVCIRDKTRLNILNDIFSDQ